MKKISFKVVGIAVIALLVVTIVVALVVSKVGMGSVVNSVEKLPADVKCSLKELRSYEIGNKFYYTKDDKMKNLGKGWCEAEVGGTWAKGNESTFYFYLDSVDENQKLYFVNLEISDTMGYTNKFYMNGVELGKINLPINLPQSSESAYVGFIIPSGIAKPGINSFMIKTEDKVKVTPHRFPKYDFEDDLYNIFLNSIYIGTIDKSVI